MLAVARPADLDLASWNEFVDALLASDSERAPRTPVLITGILKTEDDGILDEEDRTHLIRIRSGLMRARR